MPKPSAFQDKKRKILEDLAAPAENYTDLSPKGSVDDGARELCDEINGLDGYVTTSSCAGRIAVYLDGSGKDRGEDEVTESTAREAGKGGKGGGQWLFVSHDPVKTDNVSGEGEIFKMFGIQHVSPSVPVSPANGRLVYLKFEPMILHILTSSPLDAQHVYAAAYNSGFRESGIWSITGGDPTPYVAVRTQGLALETVIAYVDSDGAIKPMVTEDYVRSMLEVANQRFVSNSQRKERFRQAFLSPSTTKASSADWEPTDVRNARKRAEGLRRKEEVQRQRTNAETNAVADNLASTNSEELYSLDYS